MKRNYKNYTDEDIIAYCKESISYSQVLTRLNLKPAGGNYKNLQKNIKRLDIDISHFKHQAFNQGREFKTFENLITSESIKKRLIKKRSAACEICGISSWCKRPISIELHHIDGDNRNNLEDNLQLLCPNCHSQTDTYRNRSRV